MNVSKGLIVRLRGGFADRYGLKKESTELQTTELVDRSRIALINTLHDAWAKYISQAYGGSGVDARDRLIADVLSHVYLQVVHYNNSYDIAKILETFDNTIISQPYHSVLTLIEYLVGGMEKAAKKTDAWYKYGSIYAMFNETFLHEFIHYRFVDQLIIPITDELEIESINESMQIPHGNVREHMKKALTFLSSRDKPDYENSIKESISAVEAMCCNIVGKKTELNNALKALESKGISIHPAMRDAFIKLYGYTSDAGGIRHSLGIGDRGASYAEAKYMLVSCTAFVNFLVIGS